MIMLQIGSFMMIRNTAKGSSQSPRYFRYTINDCWEWNFNRVIVCQEQIQRYKEKQRAIDANPIKKVAEAMAKKKFKVLFNSH